MSLIQLKKYGINLSGRALGINTYLVIINNFKPPFELDLEGVISTGSSFADEVVAKLAKLNGGTIRIINSNNIIKKCLNDVSEDKIFQIVFR